MLEREYSNIIVESFVANVITGKHGTIHIKPIPGQEPFMTTMFVECSKELIRNFPLGTKFRIKAKITSRDGGTPFIYSSYKWNYEVLKD
jgi:hypothetical protein